MYKRRIVGSVSRILVAVSGGPQDEEALELACVMAKRTRARLEAIFVIEVKRSLPIDADMQAEIERGEEILDRAERSGEKIEVQMETSLLQARDVGAAIVDEAIQTHADVIVLGLVYERRFGAYELGATASYILKNAPCLVWLTRSRMQPR